MRNSELLESRPPPLAPDFDVKSELLACPADRDRNVPFAAWEMEVRAWDDTCRRRWHDAATVAALYVEPQGVYVGVPASTLGRARDAHHARPAPGCGAPPCQRWGRFWHGARANRTSTSWVTTADASRLRCKPVPLWRCA